MSTEADIQLLIAFVQVFKATTEDHEKLAEVMGGTVTANAVRQRIAKIRKKGPAISPAKNSGSQAGTPAAGKKRKDNKAKANGYHDDGNDDDEETPSKKRKRGTVKSEHSDGESVTQESPIKKAKKEAEEEDVEDEEQLFRSFFDYPEEPEV